jgi:transcriptional regulator with XRE-family HTH domain
MGYLTKKEKLSKVLIRERDRRGLSQQEVASAVGASLRNYQRWEGGETFPQAYSWQRLQDFFGESINEVMMPDVLEHPLQDRLLASDQEDTIGVSPQERQDYQSSSETDEGKAETANNRPRMSPPSQRRIKHNLIVFSTILLILILVVVGIGFLIHITNPPHAIAIKPGGAWISPSGKTIGDVIPFAAYAYPTHSGDPEIDHVNFTIYWQGGDPRKWIIACVARRPIRNDIFACNVNLRKLGAPAGQIIVSFDVYDRQGNVNLAPNGEHTLIYSPTASFAPLRVPKHALR